MTTTTNESLQAFVREGLSRYPVAKATVQLFEDQLCQLARSAIESQARNLKFSVRGVPYWRSGADRDGSSAGVVATLVHGTTQETTVECGLWWNPPDLKLTDPPVIAFASVYGKPEALYCFQPVFVDVRAHAFDYSFKGQKFTIVYTSLAEIPDPKEAMEFVIRWINVQIVECWKSLQKADPSSPSTTG